MNETEVVDMADWKTGFMSLACGHVAAKCCVGSPVCSELLAGSTLLAA